MKMIVETTGPFQLSGSTMDGADVVPFNRPAVVQATSYIQMKAAAGQVKVLHQEVPMEATDEGFLEHWKECKGDVPLAVESFMSTFVKKAPKPEPKAEPKKA